MSPTPDRTLADPQQTIADLRRELAERTVERDEASRRLDASNAERDEALERETATAEVLGVINSSPGDLAPVFDAILEKAHSLCGAAQGSLVTYDGELFRAVATRGLSEAYATLLREPRPTPPDAPPQRLLRGETLVHIPDFRTEVGPIPRAAAELEGARTVLFVQLRKEDALLGYITAYRQEVRPFSDKEIALLQNFAAQAVIAMENARLITETQEALEQQTATSEVLQVINSSPGDLAPVFDAMLEKAVRLCGAEFGVMNTFDGEHFHHAADQGVPAAYAKFRRDRGPTVYGSGTTPARLVAGEGLVHTIDLMATEPYEQGDPARRALVDLGGARSHLCVALRKGDILLGDISIYRQDVHPFIEKQIALLQNFAAQAIIAMENARLLTETREALEQQTATAEVLQVINSSPGDLAPVFDAILEKAHTLCGAAFGGLLIYDGDRFKAVALHNVPPAFVEIARQGFSAAPPNPIARLLEGEPMVHIADLKEIAEVAPTGSLPRAGVDLAGIRTLLLVPLRKGNALLGVITAYRQEVCPFSDKQIALLQNFAAQAVIAIENARLITETREALEQQTATAEVLQVINSSPGDLGPVFEAMLQKALDLCGADLGGLYRFDGKAIHPVAMQGGPESAAELLQQSFVIEPGSSVERLIRGEVEVVQVPDIIDTEAYRSGSAYRVKFIELTGARTALWVALRQDEALVGVFVIYRQEVRPFTDKQIVLLQNFAAQAVIAMENARLITETQEALEQQTATAEVLQVINASPGDLAPVFNAILEKAHSLCGAELGRLFTYDGETFWPVAAHVVSAQDTGWIREGFRPAQSNPFVRVIEGAPLVHIADIRQVAAEFPDDSGLRIAIENGHRTFLAMPLRKDDVLLGVITAVRREVRPFTDKQIALLENFAAQAVIAMENARLITETREALEQQTATAEVLGVINSSPGDLAPVFDAMLEKTLRLCEAAHGNFLTYDGEVFHQAAFRGEPQFAEYRRLPQQSAEVGQLARMVQGGGTLHRIDAREGEAYRDDPSFRRMVDGLGIRTSLTVPLLKGDALLGAVRAYRLEVRPFTDKQIALVENFAAQAVIAMENARLLGELRQRTDEVGESNRDLEARVAEQVDELGRIGRLKRFLAPQLAELIVSQGDEKILESHRREIVVVFCDLRGYTAFTETAEPEEVLDFLRQYHGALGPLVSQFEGTLDQFSGDGIMVFFNDPVPCPDPAERAVKMTLAMREAAGALIAEWRERGRDLGFGAGIAQGYATLGRIGFSERSGYTAIGTVCNVAARLCAEAKDGQILLSQLVNVALKGSVATEQLGPLALKGLSQPVAAYNVSLAASQPALRVIEGGSQSV